MPDVQRCADAWDRATRHPFLDAVREGTIAPSAFDTWLAQDALFVADLLAFQARLLARAPRSAQAVLAAGTVALVEELAWFDAQADSRGLDLNVPALPPTEEYAALLGRLDAAPYPVAVTALWALERVYLLAWQHAAPASDSYRAYVEHWTAPAFAGYVAALGEAADAAGAPLDAVPEVLELETGFWPAVAR
ncbi:MAG TPA: TenA family transcriptional regulator [Mycobacteriales bacterium]|nr:TenA family transcriptional regulator [Mycobacteriales bacterium]